MFIRFVFFLGLILCDIVEYVTSFLMEKLFHARWWDYSEEFLNIKGRICLKHTIYWGIASVAFVKLIHPQTDKIFAAVPQQLYIYIAAAVLVIFFIDVVNAVKNAIDIVKIEQKFQHLVESVEQVPSTVAESIEEIASDLKLEIARTSDKIVDKRHDAAVEILDFISEVEQWMKTAKKQLRFRQISNNPGFRRSIDSAMSKAKAAIEKISQNINKYTG
ncbi:MAG: putative ABC transporter permease [Clostridia bacterium]|nr:putative ABC transporter permease [Clostridia bacterium]